MRSVMKIRTVGILGIFILIGAVIYGNSLFNPFHYDDTATVVINRNIQTLRNIPRFFSDPRMATAIPLPSQAGHYRPLVVMSYSINYALGGLNPVGYHLVNLAFHLGSAFLIFLIVKTMLICGLEVSGQKSEVRRDSAQFFASIAAGLIFLVHPFNSEAVNYTTARSSLMSGFFYLLAFYCWVRFRSETRQVEGFLDKKSEVSGRTFYIISLVAFIAGMLSKEVVITFPVMVWLYDLYFGGRSLKPAAADAKALRTLHSVLRNLLDWRTYLPYLPFVLIVVIPYLIIRTFSFGKVVPRFERDLWTQILTELPVLVGHWKLFLWPKGLSLMHDADIYRSLVWPVLLSGVLLFLYTGASIYLAFLRQPRWRILSFFMLWFFIVLIPTTIIPLNVIFQENRGYLSVVTFAVMGGMFIGELCRKGDWKISAGVIILLAAIYSTVTVYRNRVWGDDLRLWKDTAAKAPRTADAYNGLAGTYRERGDLFLSLQTVRKGISVNPNNAFLWINLGQVHELMGDIDQAILDYKTGLEMDPNQAYLWKDLGMLYSRKGDAEHAEASFREALKLRSDDPSFYYRLGKALAERGKLTEAVDMFEKGVTLYPRYSMARFELGSTLEKLGRSGEAIVQYREIIRQGSGRRGSQALISGDGKEMKPAEKVIEEARQRLKGLTGG